MIRNGRLLTKNVTYCKIKVHTGHDLFAPQHSHPTFLDLNVSIELESKASGEASFFGLIRRQFTKPKALPAGKPLTDQVAIITGSNTGLGLEASRHLLKLGVGHLIMGVRSAAKGEKAAAPLRAEFPASKVSVWTLDMESHDSIGHFVDQCVTLPRLDVVILNAGMGGASNFASVPGTGHEITVQVNYYSTALLIILLLPVLKKQGPKKAGRKPPTLTVVSSDVIYTTQFNHAAGTPLLKQFDEPSAYSAFQRYVVSKLALLLFTCKLAETVDPNQVLVNTVNPGMTTGTNFFSTLPWFGQRIVGLIHATLARSAEIGATNYVDAVLSYGAKSHGSFVTDWQIQPYPSLYYTVEGKKLTNQLWEETMVELPAAGTAGVLEGLKK